MTEQNHDQPSDDNRLHEVLEKISELAQKSAGDDYIYRGEPECYPRVSSSLYRKYSEIDAEHFDIAVVQEEILRAAQEFASDTEQNEILSQLQHYGYRTNLIDFTKDYHIALFFACDGQPDKAGRVILLRKTGYPLMEPKIPANRIIAQKSIFVQPPQGFIEPSAIVEIPHGLKKFILEYLGKCHGLTAATIYNDLHGFIRYQSVHQSAYVEFYTGLTYGKNGNSRRAIERYSKAIELNPRLFIAYNNRGATYGELGEHEHAISDLSRAIEINPGLSKPYFNRGIEYLKIDEYEHAISDFSRVIELDPNSAESYSNRGLAYIWTGDLDSAIPDFDTAIELDPSLTKPYLNRGFAYSKKGEHHRAILDCDKVIELDLSFSIAYYYRGVNWLAIGNWEKARTDFSTAQNFEFDVASEFHKEFNSVATFEQIHNVQLPADIAAMLTQAQ